MFELCVLIISIAILLVWRYLSKPHQNGIPGMKRRSKGEGNLSDIQAAGNIFKFLKQLHAKYGPIASFWYGEEYTVSIASPELFKQHTHPFDRPPIFLKMFEPIVGPLSIQFANGEEGQNRRKMYDRAFPHDNWCSHCEIFQKSADVLIRQWTAKGPEEHIPLCEETFKFVVKSSLCSILGEYFENDETVNAFRKAYVKVRDELKIVFADPSLCEKAETMKQFNEALDVLKTSIKKAVEHRKQRTSQGKLVIDDILEFASSEDMVLSDSLTYVVGSFHNTGNMLASCLYYLAKFDEVQEKVYKEIVDALGDKGLVDDVNVKELKYLHQVINETLRCGQFGSFAARYQETETQLGGCKIPKNTPVIHALGLVMADEKLWPSPDKFDPDRFNEENMRHRHPFAFQPFGFAGRRKCPAYKYVPLKAAVFLTSVLQRFKIRLHGDQKVTHEVGMSTYLSDEIWLKVIKR